MTDSPRSGIFGRRENTPIIDLDDHRHQQPLPRTDTMSSTGGHHTRRGTLASIVAERPDPNLLSVQRGLEGHDITARDFECAIAEDASMVGSPTIEAREGNPPLSPLVPRRTTLRRTSPRVDRPSRSRASSGSSGSSSPPNSIEAFADARRRGRSGTMNSNAPSQQDLGLHRSNSNGTQRTNKRRGTFSEGRINHRDDETASRHSSVEDDVCYPQSEDDGEEEAIDFEELDELIALSRRQANGYFNMKAGSSTAVNSDAHSVNCMPIPKIVTQVPSPDGRPGSSAEPDSDELDEKMSNLERVGTKGSDQLTRGTEVDRKPKPQLWTFLSTDLDDTIHATSFAGLLSEGESTRDLFKLREPDSGIWWLDVLNATDDELFAICKAFGVHPLTREDIETQESREKVELFRSYYFVAFRSFKQETDTEADDFLEPVNVYVVVFREGLLTFTFSVNPHAANVRKRIARLKDYMQLSADWVCYALM